MDGHREESDHKVHHREVDHRAQNISFGRSGGDIAKHNPLGIACKVVRIF